VSERLLFNTNSAIFQLYHGENKLIINEMVMGSALYYTSTLSGICIVLAHVKHQSLTSVSSEGKQCRYWIDYEDTYSHVRDDTEVANITFGSLIMSKLK
jgi:hypothetical protein